MQNQRTATRNAGLDNQVRLHQPDHFLQGDDVLRILNDRQSEPAEMIRVLLLCRLCQPLAADLLQIDIRPHAPDELAVSLVKVVHALVPYMRLALEMVSAGSSRSRSEMDMTGNGQSMLSVASFHRMPRAAPGTYETDI